MIAIACILIARQTTNAQGAIDAAQPHPALISKPVTTLADVPGYQNYLQAKRNRNANRARGVVDNVRWAKDGSCVVFDAANGRQQLDFRTGQIRKAGNIATVPSLEGDTYQKSQERPAVPRAQQHRSERSPDGTMTAVYKDFNVWIRDQKNLKLRPITNQGTDRLRYGTGCWVYGEELEQDTAMWWSPDGRKLAFYEIDERGMRDYVLTVDNTQRYTRTQSVRYPKSGDQNPQVHLLIYDLDSLSTMRVSTGTPGFEYIYNVRFSPQGDDLLFTRSNRMQNRLEIVAADVATGKTRVVVVETQPTFQAFKPAMRMVDRSGQFIWETERTGWKNFELRSLDQQQQRVPLSEFSDFPCDEILWIDRKAGLMYYSAFSDDSNPYNRQLHRCLLDGTGRHRITTAELNHSDFLVSPDHRWVIAVGQRFDRSPVTILYPANTKADTASTPQVGARPLFGGAKLTPDGPPTAASMHNEIFQFTANDGATAIYGTLQKPSDFDPSKSYPLLVDVYGGPQSEGISNRFAATNPVCELGFLVAKIGNRGTINRGKAFESATYLNLGGVDLDDQVAGVTHLAKRSYIDRRNVGIFGHSYGGYLSALAVLKYPDIFKAAVAGAPVTDWKNYDTIYTERYMQTPSENPDGYRRSSCLTYADSLTGKLLLVHGLIDDNVHPANTWQLVDALQRNDQRFDLMVYPNFKHGIGSTYSSLRLEYFCRHLK
jgi:dipeptidyl-peptidase-4